ncbi:MAG TPA: hypothetical protein VGX68_03940 [Thermoanaerobaculia bacterium]|jgi:DNA-directed RNA polymerase specialized sigma24 family protein|nr:hypothetical protein [Thermoanaerobaculia bacterium]
MALSDRTWSLTGGALALLLERLGRDVETAAQRYEELRRRLVRYFEWNGSNAPEEHADRVFDRLMRRLEQGEKIERVEAYAHGVARLVLLESRREEEARSTAVRDVLAPARPMWAAPKEDSAKYEQRLFALRRGLSQLPLVERELVLAYYRDEGEGRMAKRRKLAAQLDVPAHVLRARVHRIRLKLERCLRSPTEGSEGSAR